MSEEIKTPAASLAKGCKTSEFWLMLASILFTELTVIVANVPVLGAIVTGVAMILGSMGYTGFRSSVKKAELISNAAMNNAALAAAGKKAVMIAD